MSISMISECDYGPWTISKDCCVKLSPANLASSIEVFAIMVRFSKMPPSSIEYSRWCEVVLTVSCYYWFLIPPAEAISTLIGPLFLDRIPVSGLILLLTRSAVWPPRSLITSFILSIATGLRLTWRWDVIGWPVEVLEAGGLLNFLPFFAEGDLVLTPCLDNPVFPSWAYDIALSYSSFGLEISSIMEGFFST